MLHPTSGGTGIAGLSFAAASGGTDRVIDDVALSGSLNAERGERVQLLCADGLSGAGEHVRSLRVWLSDGMCAETQHDDGGQSGSSQDQVAHV